MINTSEIANWTEKLPRWRYRWMLALFTLIVCFGALDSREIWSGDETRVAGIAAEMAVSGDDLIPRLNGTPFLEYPPLYYMVGAYSFRLFGFEDFAAKLPSALAAFGAGMLLFALAGVLRFDKLSSFCGAVALVSSAQFFSNARLCRVDMMLAFFVLLAVYGFAGLLRGGRRRDRFFFWFLAAGGFAGGVMTKGLIGLVLPGAALGSFVILDDLLHRTFRPRRYLELAAAALAGLLPAAVWSYMVFRRLGYDAFYEVAIYNNFGRFSGTHGDHAAPFYEYFGLIPEQMQPYLIFVLIGIWYFFREVKRNRSSEALLVLCFLLVPFLALSLASGKRQVYLLPLYAPAAIMAGAMLKRFITGDFRWPKFFGEKWAKRVTADRILAVFLPAAAAALTVAGVVLATFPGAVAVYYPILLTAFAAAAFWLRREGRGIVFGLIALALLYCSIDSSVMAARNDRESLREIFEFCREAEDNGWPAVMVDAPERTRGGAFFYLGHRLPEWETDEIGDGRQLVIVRDRETASEIFEFADHHYVFLLAKNKKIKNTLRFHGD